MKHFRSLSIAVAILFFLVPGVRAQSSFVTRVITPAPSYELLLGDTLAPSIMVTKFTSASVTGVMFYVRIQNIVTGITTYEDSVAAPNLTIGDSMELTFAPYVTSIDSLDQLGTFDVCVMTGDTDCLLLFGVRRTAVPFIATSDDYSKTGSTAFLHTSLDIPDQTLWASAGATVVDGETATWDPPPPRYPNGGVGPDAMVAPVIRLDRLDYNGNYYSGKGVGDTLTSFPINLQGKTKVTVSFDYMRAGRHRYPLGWDADTLFGPESTILNAIDNSVTRAGDSLVLEFLDPSQSSENPNAWNEIAAIDGGRDFEFKTLYAHGDSNSWQISVNGVTKTLTGTPNYFTSDFRFRLRLKAQGDLAGHDDADAWYIDNARVTIPIYPSVEMNWVRVVNPYTEIPKSQAVFPVFVHIVPGNSHGWNTQPYSVQIVDPAGTTVYSQTVTPIGGGNAMDTILQFPDWDATAEPAGDTGAFTAIATADPLWSVPAEFDTAYTKFYLRSGQDNGIQEFALDMAAMTFQSFPGRAVSEFVLRIPREA